VRRGGGGEWKYGKSATLSQATQLYRRIALSAAALCLTHRILLFREAASPY